MTKIKDLIVKLLNFDLLLLFNNYLIKNLKMEEHSI